MGLRGSKAQMHQPEVDPKSQFITQMYGATK